MNPDQNINTPKPMSKSGQLLFGLILIAGYTAAFYFLIWPNFSKSLQTFNWSPTQAEVTELRRVTYWDDVKQPSNEWEIRGNSEGWEFELILTYSYTIDGTRYEGQNVRWSQALDEKEDFSIYRGSSLADALRLEKKYKNNSELTVYYNPDNTSEALLKKGPSLKQWLVQIALLIIPLLGLLMVFMAFKKPVHAI
jgi:hypothetical protein